MLIEENNPYYKKAAKREQSFWENDYFGIQKDSKQANEITEYENFNKSGDKDVDYLTYLKTLGIFENGLSIGGGFGEEELSVVSRGVVHNMTFMDFSEGSNVILEKNAKKLHIHDRIFTINGDLNFITLEPNKYDFIICRNVLHHIINLEECLFELNKSLTKDGIIVIDDFVGATKFQWTDQRISFINKFRKFLKEKYALETPPFIRTNKKTITNNCPFEAIRSDELYGLITYYFGKNKVKENLYGYLFEDHGFYINQLNSDIFQDLQSFENTIKKEKLFSAPRLFGVYKKGDSSLLKSKSRTKKQIKENIGILPFSELQLMRIASNLKKLFPGIYQISKKIYFLIRR